MWTGPAVQPGVSHPEAGAVQEVLLPLPRVEGGAGGGRGTRRRGQQGSLGVHRLTTFFTFTTFP